MDLWGWPRKEWRWWSSLSRNHKAGHLTQVLLSLLMVGGGWVIHLSPPMGTMRAINENLSLLGTEFIAVSMILCGGTLSLLKYPKMIHVFLLTLPLLIYLVFSYQAWLLGYISLTGPFFLTILYLLLLVNFWGWRE